MVRLPRTGAEIYAPNELPIVEFDSIEIPELSCIYLVCSKGEVIYVGQTVNLKRRMRDHLKSERFRHYKDVEIRWQVENDKVIRLRLEGIYILNYMPPENKAILLRIHAPKVTEIRWSKNRKAGKRWGPKANKRSTGS
jgi:hypothetical protein